MSISNKQARPRKRAAEACAACRSRKVRCDVIHRLPCVRCHIEGKECVISDKSAQRQISSSSERFEDIFGISIRSPGPESLDADISTLMPAESNLSVDLFDTFLIDQDANAILDLNSSSNHQYRAGKPINYSIHGNQLIRREEYPGANDGLSPCGISNDVACGPIQSQSQSTRTFPHIPCRFETSHLSTEDISYLRWKGVFQLPSKALQDELLKQYFLYIHPFNPILSEKDFWEDYQNGLNQTSLLLYRSILSAAITYLSPDLLDESGYSSLSEAQNIYYTRAKLLFDFEVEKQQLVRVQASLLLSYWQIPRKESSTRDNHYWLSGAICIAKGLGLHQHEAMTKTEMATPMLLKRLWHSCVFRDICLALSFRRVPVVRISDHGCLPLNPEDIVDDPDVSRLYSPKASLKLSKMRWLLSRLMPLISKLLEAKFSTPPQSNDATMAPPASLVHLLDIERMHAEFVLWHKAFLATEDIYYVEYGDSDYKPLMLHRNFALMLYNSALVLLNQPRKEFFGTIPSTWSDSLKELFESAWLRAQQAAYEITSHVKELAHLGLTRSISVALTQSIACAVLIQSLSSRYETLPERANSEASLRVCFHALKCLQERYPVVDDVIALIHAALKVGQQGPVNHESFEVVPGGLSDAKFSMSKKTSFSHFVHIFRVVSYFDLSYTLSSVCIEERDLPELDSSLISLE